MRTNRAPGFALAVLLVLAACGSNQGEGTAVVSPDGAILPTPNQGSSTGSGTGVVIVSGSGTGTNSGTGTGSGTGTSSSGTGSSGGMCPSSCTTDAQCQATCPAAPGALNCCDTVTNACFTSAASVCPDMAKTTVPDASTGY